jgi:hypothetical protein
MSRTVCRAERVVVVGRVRAVRVGWDATETCKRCGTTH